MNKEELLKYLIIEIDLIMHDKDYRFENEDGSWYSRESCRNLTNEEVFEELKAELRQLADLEAKLAESENQLQKYERLNGWTINGYTLKCFDEEIGKLKQQLAEKEKEIEDLKNNHYLLKKDYIVDYFVSQTNEPMPIPKFVTNQDKISFAIAELEKVKELFEERYRYDVEESEYAVVYEDDIDEIIDNQIKQLKEGK